MTTKVGKEQTDLHVRSVQVVRRKDNQPTALGRERGHQWSLFGPADGSQLDVHLIELDPGGLPGHFHLHPTSENIYIVIAGAISVRHAGGTVRLGAGDAIRFPTGAPHAAAVVGKRPARLIEIYCPAPAEFVLAEQVHREVRS
jgi:mannose-6-phosphate isomerase-like protein (cupin superfamily)